MKVTKGKRTTVGIFRHIECKKKKFVILVRLDVPSRLIPLGFNFHLCYYYILQRKKRRRFLQNGQLGTNFGKMRPLLLNRGVILSWPCRCVFWITPLAHWSLAVIQHMRAPSPLINEYLMAYNKQIRMSWEKLHMECSWRPQNMAVDMTFFPCCRIFLVWLLIEL